MTIFEAVKSTVTPRMAAEHFGLNVGRNGMICCPFHDDRHPSMKLNEDYFYCFGCGAKGDVIEFTSKLFGITALEAAQKLSTDFSIKTDKPSVLAKLSQYRTQADNERLCFRVLREYLQILQDWKVRFSPQSPDAIRVPAETQQSGFGGKRTNSEMSELSPQGGSEGYGACEDVDDRFVEACHMLECTQYMLDLLTIGSSEERTALVSDMMKDNKITLLQERLQEIKEESNEQA